MNSIEVDFVDMNYGEGSVPNKRPYVEEEPASQPSETAICQPIQQPQIPRNPTPGPLPYQIPSSDPKYLPGILSNLKQCILSRILGSKLNVSKIP